MTIPPYVIDGGGGLEVKDKKNKARSIKIIVKYYFLLRPSSVQVVVLIWSKSCIPHAQMLLE